MKPRNLVIALILLVLVLDQGTKFWVKTHMLYGEEFALFGWNWLRIHFVENNGMAFGLQFGGANGKLALSLFRLAAVVMLTYYLHFLLKSRQALGLICSFSLILAGALGNILDSAFYGLLFSASGVHSGVAEFLPAGGGYAGLFHGKVVDMIYLPVWSGVLPSWVPFFGGDYAQFFKPVFNLADLSITLGVLLVLFFHTSAGRQGLEKEVNHLLPLAEVAESRPDTAPENTSEPTARPSGSLPSEEQLGNGQVR